MISLKNTKRLDLIVYEASKLSVENQEYILKIMKEMLFDKIIDKAKVN